jgi:hypothetical protein
MYNLCSKPSVFVQVNESDNNKDTSLLHNLSIFCTLRIRNVLWYRDRHPGPKQIKPNQT